jgi:hypothetical protein
VIASMPERITLYTRPGCGLCDTMKAELAHRGYDVVEVNIDEDPELARRYLWEIPVAARADGTILARHRLEDRAGSLGPAGAP